MLWHSSKSVFFWLSHRPKLTSPSKIERYNMKSNCCRRHEQFSLKRMTNLLQPRQTKNFLRLTKRKKCFSRKKTLKNWEIVLTSSKRRDRKFSSVRQFSSSNCSLVSTSVSTPMKSQTMTMASLKFVQTFSIQLPGFVSFPLMTASNTPPKCTSTKLMLLSCRLRLAVI